MPKIKKLPHEFKNQLDVARLGALAKNNFDRIFFKKSVKNIALPIF